MKKISETELKDILKKNHVKKLNLSGIEVENADLSMCKFADVDLNLSVFRNTIFNGADFSRANLVNGLFDGCLFQNVNFTDADLKSASLRNCDLTGSVIKGTNLYCTVLENAVLTDVVDDEHTCWFRMHCPNEGAFLGYKKCVNDRLVRLLIPADAKRTSATLPSCRCSKAKVLKIENFEGTEEYEEAWSLVDENFVYKKGKWVEVSDFNEDRFIDSTTGIHFWMTREDAINY